MILKTAFLKTKILILLVAGIVFTSCTKEKPPTGMYTASFYSDEEMTNPVCVFDIEIIEVNDTSVTFQSDYVFSLSKSDKTISGFLNVIEDHYAYRDRISWMGFSVEGELKHENGKICIKGLWGGYTHSMGEIGMYGYQDNYYAGYFKIVQKD